MAKKNYYKMLGVSRTASPEEISAAKNRLAKKISSRCQHEEWYRYNQKKCSRSWKPTAYFPIRRNVLLTTAKYSESHLQVQTGTLICSNLHNMEETAPVTGTPFVNYWRAADSLYDITLESEQLFKEKIRNRQRTGCRIFPLRHSAMP